MEIVNFIFKSAEKVFGGLLINRKLILYYINSGISSLVIKWPVLRLLIMFHKQLVKNWN